MMYQKKKMVLIRNKMHSYFCTQFTQNVHFFLTDLSYARGLYIYIYIYIVYNVI